MTKQNLSKQIEEKLIAIFVEIIQKRKPIRTASLIFLLSLLIAGIYGAVKVSILMLFLPVVGYFAMKRLINPLHDKNVAKYLEVNRDKIGAEIVLAARNLSQETKMNCYREALLTEIRNSLNKRQKSS
ncbi:MAG: hypothetical protein KGQ36_00900 [Rickettsiales bacterium]|nr:hypothetical protein [Rickettsiales bacterium]